MKHNLIPFANSVALALALSLSSCGTKNLVVSSVDYQSIRTSFAQPAALPEDAKIAAQYFISSSGALVVIVYNRTDEILTIDQTKSFFVNTTGSSTSYYDPTIRTQTSGSFSSESSGSSLNLGAVANAFGVGGALGALMGGTTVYEGNTVGALSSSTVTVQDQPTVHVGPHGKMVMSKQFPVTGVGHIPSINNYVDVNQKMSPLKFTVCISYSFEGMDEPDKIVTDFYVNTCYRTPVSRGKVSDAFRQIYRIKPDALAENAFMFKINTNLPEKPEETILGDIINTENIYSDYVHGSLIDYK